MKTLGRISEDSRAPYRRILQRRVDTGAEGIILRCTEMALLVGSEDARVPRFDTTDLHACFAAA